MSFTYDIFISYAHLDNRSPIGGEKGWINLLHDRLSILVAQTLGAEVRIWRDGHNLQGNFDLQKAIDDGVKRSLLLVPVISPRYVQSEWCSLEIDTFQECSRPTQAAPPEFSSRIFKVFKTPLPEHLKDREPRQIRNMFGYQFFGVDESDGQLREFGTDPIDKSYWKTLNRLVSDLAKSLIDLKYSKDLQPEATPRDLVYLAETTSDLTKERELVRDELRQRGHIVVPEQKLPVEEAKQTEALVRTELARCSLSVHLVGKKYGSTPEDDPRSIVLIQHELAAERSQNDPTFQRLLWMPKNLGKTPDMEVRDERQKSFIAAIQAGVGKRAELLQETIVDLNTRIVEKLNPRTETPARIDRRLRPKQIYLICVNRDRDLIRPITTYLFEQRFEVITWLEEGATETLMEYHRKNLKESDAALIYFGNADEPWVRKNIDDLEKAYGYGRETEWAANAIYVGAPPNLQKEDFRTHLVPYVIRNFHSFDPNDLRDFVSAVQSR